MREILFRGKRLDNGEWMQGDLLQDPDLGGVTISWFGYDVFEHGIERWETSESVVPETVGQYTGLTDKNRKKIFEGDICRIENHHLIDDAPYVVEWEEFVYNGWVWRDLDSDGTMDSFNNSAAKHCEIIGNIHDNPELLKGE